MFKGEYADTCAEHFSLESRGDKRPRQSCADGERGPPLVPEEMFSLLRLSLFLLGSLLFSQKEVSYGFEKY